MENCLFCRIVRGELPSFKVYEDNLFFGFLDIRPLNPGNVLLVPKNHYRWVTDVLPFAEYWLAAKKIGLAAQAAVKADYISYLTLGMEVHHAHIRIIPRFYNDDHTHGIDATKTIEISKDEMLRISKEISSRIVL